MSHTNNYTSDFGDELFKYNLRQSLTHLGFKQVDLYPHEWYRNGLVIDTSQVVTFEQALIMFFEWGEYSKVKEIKNVLNLK